MYDETQRWVESWNILKEDSKPAKAMDEVPWRNRRRIVHRRDEFMIIDIMRT